MGLRNKGRLSELKARMNAAKQRIDLAVFERLSRLGEELVNYARSIPADAGYTDQTGNLRSSTGYIIVKDGNVLKANFEKRTGIKTDSKDGKLVGYNHALTVASEHSSGYALIVVAGMDYALAVESRGKDVLTTTEHMAKKRMPNEVKRLREQIRKMKL